MKRRDEILLWNRFVNTRERDDERLITAREHPEGAYAGGPSLRMVARDVGVAEKRAGYLAEKWAREGVIEGGVSIMAPWLTPEGARAEIGVYGFTGGSENEGMGTMTQNDTETETDDAQRYRVECDECGVVSFSELDFDWFGNEVVATWYAGYHSGKEHPDSEFQMAFAEPSGEGTDS